MKGKRLIVLSTIISEENKIINSPELKSRTINLKIKFVTSGKVDTPLGIIHTQINKILNNTLFELI